MGTIKTAVFPVAGFGSRFLPITKAIPKEMLPIVDKPLIQYAVEEVIDAGVKQMVFITGRNKRAIEDHFDIAYELETELRLKNKVELADQIKNIIPEDVSCIYVRQNEMLGLGHAISCARPVVGNNPFFVILADDLIYSKKSVCKQMLEVFDKKKASVLAVQVVEKQNLKAYGVVDLDNNNDASKTKAIKGIVEKPIPNEAPSNLGVVGRYILTPKIFDELISTKPGSGGEIQLTDAIASLMTKEKIYSYLFEGNRYDCGSKLGYLQANIKYSLLREEVNTDLRNFLKTCL